eukprot:2606362-Rhodomonas_salina.1
MSPALTYVLYTDLRIGYAMSGTVLRACYAMFGTVLCACYATPGTDVAPFISASGASSPIQLARSS